ncbi:MULTISPECIES: acyltransferase family protein [Streptomyces]|uniref:acyltransferase family protein n=1 Tax=Streptomyces TaxID=1883 RepID=UPI001030E20F|nr:MULTISPECIES: acyltransferase family protein [Streptomyces]
MASIMKKLFGRRARSKSRDPWWDNVRYTSGTLVVVGHTIEPLRDMDGPLWLWMVTWALRLPVFVMVCGYFSSAGPLNLRESRRILESIALPYIFFSILQTLQVRWLEGEWKIYLGLPKWTLWFLLSLIVWRVALPYVVALRYPFTMTVAASLAIGYFNEFGAEFSASRTVALFPFFVLGWKIKEGLFAGLFERRWTRGLSVGLLLGSGVVAWLVRHDVRIGWTTMAAPYESQAEFFGTYWAWVFRATLLAWGIVMGLSLINLVPRRRIPVVTYLGAGGMYIYLLHPLVLRPLRETGIFERVDQRSEQLLIILAAVVLAALLASPPVRLLAKPVVQPSVSWLFSRAVRDASAKRPPKNGDDTAAPAATVPPQTSETRLPAEHSGAR